MNNIITIMKKELTRFFTDKKMVFTSIIMPGLMIYIIYSLMGGFIQDMVTTDEDYKYKISVMNMPEVVESMFEEQNAALTEIDQSDIEDTKEDIKNEKVDVLMVFPEDFEEVIDEYDVQSGQKAPEIELYYNSATTNSANAQMLITATLDAYENSLSNKFDVNFDEKHDLNDGADFSEKMVFAMIPMLLMTLITSGCVAIGPDFIAGEKERGTIATLLVTPVKRGALAVGKIISMLIIAVLCAISSGLGLILSLPKLMGDAEIFKNASLTAAQYTLFFVVILSSACVLIAFVAVLSAQANTVKEAGTSVAPFNILIMVLSVAGGYTGGEKLSKFVNLIPVFNGSRCMSDMLLGVKDSFGLSITIVSNFAYAIVLIFILTKMFSSEKIMFSK